MKDVTPQDILKGNQKQAELKETSRDFDNTEGLGKNNKRMAGPGGARALELMQDPEAKAKTDQWMGLFGMSNQGAEFERAKLEKAAQGLI